MTRFDDATASEPEGEGRWRAEIREGWDIGGVPNGGYVLALATRALLGTAGKPDPVSVTAHYLRPTRPGPATVEATLLKPGRTVETVYGTLVQDGEPRLAVLASLADLGAAEHLPVLHDRTRPPDLPPPERCPRVVHDPGTGFPPPFVDRIEVRTDPALAAFTRGEVLDRAEIAGWLRHGDGAGPDPLSLLMFADAMAPPIFNVGIGPAWVPTLELTVHVRRRPRPGWLRARFTTRLVAGGFLEEDGEIWDSGDRLVAQSRQLALAPRQDSSATGNRSV